MLSICPKCSKQNDNCTCDMFKGLESAYDQPNSKGLEEMQRDISKWTFKPIDNAEDAKKLYEELENVSTLPHITNIAIPDEDIDLGSHYRHSFMGYNMDVYRVLEIFKVTCPVAQHIIKKLLRGEGKGHTMDFVWNEVKQAVERKFEMMEEDK